MRWVTSSHKQHGRLARGSWCSPLGKGRNSQGATSRHKGLWRDSFDGSFDGHDLASAMDANDNPVCAGPTRWAGTSGSPGIGNQCSTALSSVAPSAYATGIGGADEPRRRFFFVP